MKEKRCQAFSFHHVKSVAGTTMRCDAMWCSVRKWNSKRNKNMVRIQPFVLVWKFFLLSKWWSFICDRQERNEYFMNLVSNGSLAFTFQEWVLIFNGNSVVLYSWLLMSGAHFFLQSRCVHCCFQSLNFNHCLVWPLDIYRNVSTEILENVIDVSPYQLNWATGKHSSAWLAIPAK